VADDESGYLITPPPGLFPNAPKAAPAEVIPAHTESGTHKFAREAAPTAASVQPPAFFPAPLGAQPRAVSLTLERSDGTRHVISSAAVLGRNPAASGDWSHATAIAVPDPEKSISKTHAAVAVSAQGSTIVDLNSTNGTFIVKPDGSEFEIDPGQSASLTAGDTVMLGKVMLRVVA
jgi:pSer/pThr/pTyr-binding forkhead associated (FHA) protein